MVSAKPNRTLCSCCQITWGPARLTSNVNSRRPMSTAKKRTDIPATDLIRGMKNCTHSLLNRSPVISAQHPTGEGGFRLPLEPGPPLGQQVDRDRDDAKFSVVT